LKEEFTFIGNVPEAERFRGTLPPSKKEECEVKIKFTQVSETTINIFEI
jgi:hypothetical protein